jgi:putative tryptophan/tyrosine transport system substrate-binding protein
MRFYYSISALCLILLNLFFVSCLANSSKNVALVASNVYINMLHRVEGALFSEPTPRPNLIRIDPLKQDSLDQLNHIQFDLIVTLGLESTEAILNLTKSEAILAVLVQKNPFLGLKQSHPERKLTAIFLDHPIGRQLNLVQHLMLPSEQHLPIGVILGPTSSSDRDILQQEAHERHLSLKIIHVNANENPVHSLGLVLNSTSLLFALPDPYVFNPDTARGILLAAFRKKIPLVGYTRTYVSKGALAAVYSTPQQIAKEAAAFILDITEKPITEYPAPRFPKAFAVTVNQQAARSLERFIDSEAAIQYAMQTRERLSPEGEYCSIISRTNIQ